MFGVLVLCAVCATAAAALQCYEGEIYVFSNGTRKQASLWHNHDPVLTKCAPEYDACLMVGENVDSLPWAEEYLTRAHANFSRFSLGCGFSTVAKFFVKDQGGETVLPRREWLKDLTVASTLYDNLTDTCIMGEEDHLCVCATDKCNDFDGYYKPTRCFDSTANRRRPFATPLHRLSGLGACGRVKYISVFELARNGSEVWVDIPLMAAKTDLLTLPQCRRIFGSPGGTDRCFRSLMVVASSAPMFVDLEMCCCEGELCNDPDRLWQRPSLPGFEQKSTWPH